MVDLLTIILTHMLMLIAAWRLLERDDLDEEAAPDRKETRPWLAGRGVQADQGGGERDA